MKLRIKVALCMLLGLLALMSAAAVLGDLGVLPASAEGQGYVLRTYHGRIGLFWPPEAAEPAEVTDILVRDLPLGDQMELAAGITVEDHAAAVHMLEDYGG